MKLYNLLPEKDKELLIEYINKYGINKEDFIGLETWLKHWDKDKRKLYKLLGNQFQVEFPVQFTKNEYLIVREVDKLIYGRDMTSFVKAYNKFIRKGLDATRTVEGFYGIKHDEIYKLKDLIYTKNLVENKIDFSLIIEREDKKKKIRLQNGMKTMKALQTVVNCFPEYFDFDDFEQFRIEHSKIFNDKNIKGTVVISIHPLDFLTMSDNNSNWSSCMSWMNDGCYHLGTVEMMNSNNVVCAYLKSQTSFYFDEDNSLEWNNKKWRQLFYVTKEINVSGKPYPYYNEELTRTVLNKITELAKENLGWSYQYGIEEYLDMKSIRGLYDIEKHQRKIAEGNTEKKNIIFHSNVMYNDMLNDNRTQYLCYRNKVNKTKIINYSGKASCLVCGESAVEESDYPDDYNDRFWHADRVICDCCYEESRCEWCGKIEGKSKVKFIGKRFSCSKEGKRICADCYKYYVYKCPCCGDDFFVEDHGTMPNDIPVLRLSEKIYYEDFSQCEYDYNFRCGTLPTRERIENLNSSLIPVFTCRECLINKLMGYGEEEALFEEVTDITRKNTMYFKSRTYRGIVSSKVYTLDEIFNDEKLSSLIPINLVKSSS